MVIKTTEFTRFFRHNLRVLFLKNTQINICELEMIKLLQRPQPSKLVNARLRIRASNPRATRKIGTISSHPERLKSQEYPASLKWGITNLYISNFI